MEEEKRKLIMKGALLGGTITILLILTIVLTIKLISIKEENENENNIENLVQLEENVITENEIENNEVVNEENTENVEENEEINSNKPVINPEEEVGEEVLKEEDKKQKAINMAKEDWGTDNTVYFSYDGIENGKHKVTVRDQNTYKIKEYYIDVENETFTIKE